MSGKLEGAGLVSPEIAVQEAELVSAEPKSKSFSFCQLMLWMVEARNSPFGPIVEALSGFLDRAFARPVTETVLHPKSSSLQLHCACAPGEKPLEPYMVCDHR